MLYYLILILFLYIINLVKNDNLYEKNELITLINVLINLSGKCQHFLWFMRKLPFPQLTADYSTEIKIKSQKRKKERSLNRGY
jgi:hypothetical protein